MQLDLSDDDVELLKDVLVTALDRLTSEIGHTDNPVYRQNLKGRRDRLRGLIDVFGGQAASVTARPRVVPSHLTPAAAHLVGPTHLPCRV